MPLPTTMKRSIYLLSDSSGNLLEHFLNAILTQFPRESFRIGTLPFLKNETELSEALEKIHEGIIFHAVVEKTLKKFIAKECKKRGFFCLDITKPAVDFLADSSGIPASVTPQSIHSFDSNYRGRIEALEFTMQHDDGRRLEEIEKADIVLVGISRVSKSPNALFLAYRGFRVSNISMVPGVELPLPLEKRHRQNVVALTINPKRLTEIRTRRFANWELGQTDYSDLSSITQEILQAERLYKEKGWPIIDTTDLVVEETSALILSVLHLKPKILEQ